MKRTFAPSLRTTPNGHWSVFISAARHPGPSGVASSSFSPLSQTLPVPEAVTYSLTACSLGDRMTVTRYAADARPSSSISARSTSRMSPYSAAHVSQSADCRMPLGVANAGSALNPRAASQSVWIDGSSGISLGRGTRKKRH